MLQYYIMKKLLFALIFIFAAALLSGCSNDNGTRVVMFTENPPNLTTMTMTTTSFVDTFSEYMATYSESEATSESGRGTSFTRLPGAAPDTAFRGGGAEQVSRDTAAVFTHVMTEEVSSFGEETQTTAVTEVPESETESTSTSVAETTAETENSTVITVSVPNVTRDTALGGRPQRDTVFSPAISADTVYSNTTNGGTSNAN